MNATNTPIGNEKFETLQQRAIDALRAFEPQVLRWVESVRPPDGARGRFRWAVQTTREANVGSTSYVAGALVTTGLFDRVITAEDKAQGIAWVESMRGENEQYHDPAILCRPSPNWPADKPWPSPGLQNVMNQYARTVLSRYGVDLAELGEAVPPDGWPQADDPEGAVEWIKTRPFDVNAWGAGSHAMRMATFMLGWHKRGRIPLDPVIRALKFFYEIQNPSTGLWGASKLPLYNRINGTFKLFPLIREQLDLPLPHADKIIDQVLTEFYRPDYDKTVGGCDDFDNWYVIALALDPSGGHREEEIRRLAAYRITRSLEIFGKPDGGLSFTPGACSAAWTDADMAPSIPQGDAVAVAVITSGINICVDLAGLKGRTPWTGVWRMRTPENPELREKIRSLVFDRESHS